MKIAGRVCKSSHRFQAPTAGETPGFKIMPHIHGRLRLGISLAHGCQRWELLFANGLTVGHFQT
jgi:hypothetical protein